MKLALFLLFISYTPLFAHPLPSKQGQAARAHRHAIKYFSENNAKAALLILWREELPYRLEIEKNNDSVSTCLFTISFCLNALSRNDDALKTLHFAHKINPNDASICSKLAEIYRDKGDFSSAKKWYEKSISINLNQKNDIDKNDISENYNNLADIENSLNNYDAAQKNAETALQFANNEELKGRIFINLANAFLFKTDYAQAVLYYQNANKLLPTTAPEHAFALQNIGLCYKYLHKIEQAETFLKQTLVYYQKKDTDPNDLAATYDNLAGIYLYKKEYEKALFYYKVALEKNTNPADKFLYLADQANAYYQLAIAQNTPKNLLLARKTYELADKQADKLTSGDIKNKLFWREKVHHIYGNAINLCYLQNDPEKALYYIEKSHAILLLDQIKDKTAISNTAAIQQKLLNDKTSFIAYFVQDSIFYTLVINAENALPILTKNVFPRKKLLEFIDLLKDSRNKSSNMEKIQAFETDLACFIPLKNNLKEKLVISPDEILCFLPLEAIPIEKNKNIIDNYTISYTYSASTLLAFQQKSQQESNYFFVFSTKKILIFAPIHFEKYKLPTLSATEIAAQKLAKNYDATLYLGKKASKKAFLETANSAEILQLFTHASGAPNSENDPCLYLSDTLLLLKDIGTKKQLTAKLAVLTACETNSGKEAKGEGIQSLAYSFAQAGIPATVATLWEVEDEASSKITTYFYQSLEKGLPKDEALRAAKLHLRQNEPYINLWAATILYGNTASIPLDKPNFFSHFFVYFTVFGIILALLLLLLNKNKKQYNIFRNITL